MEPVRPEFHELAAVCSEISTTVYPKYDSSNMDKDYEQDCDHHYVYPDNTSLYFCGQFTELWIGFRDYSLKLTVLCKLP